MARRQLRHREAVSSAVRQVNSIKAISKTDRNEVLVQ